MNAMSVTSEIFITALGSPRLVNLFLQNRFLIALHR